MKHFAAVFLISFLFVQCQQTASEQKSKPIVAKEFVGKYAKVIDMTSGEKGNDLDNSFNHLAKREITFYDNMSVRRYIRMGIQNVMTDGAWSLSNDTLLVQLENVLPEYGLVKALDDGTFEVTKFDKTKYRLIPSK